VLYIIISESREGRDQAVYRQQVQYIQHVQVHHPGSASRESRHEYSARHTSDQVVQQRIPGPRARGRRRGDGADG
jgi:hypothetical protein